MFENQIAVIAGFGEFGISIGAEQNGVWAVNADKAQLLISVKAIVRCSRSRPTTSARANVAKARKEAVTRGLDPNTWFNNVELVIGEQIGTQTTTYVRNIYKYYVAYKLTLDAQAEADKARSQVAPTSR